MIVSSIREFCPDNEEWQHHWAMIERAESFPGLVCSALQLGLVFARWVLSTELNNRAQLPQTWPMCEQCGHRLRSKGFRPRQLTTLIGVVP